MSPEYYPLLTLHRNYIALTVILQVIMSYLFVNFFFWYIYLVTYM